MNSELYYQLGLQFKEGISSATIRRLVNAFGSAKAAAEASVKDLKEVEGLGLKKIKALQSKIDDARVNREIKFIEQHSIRPLFFTDPLYPQKLLQINDAPALLFYKGTADLNARRQLAVIGTRRCSEYGKSVTETLITALQEQNVTIVSGLAYGIDVIAHKKALQCNLPTIGVLAHGLDRIYPDLHIPISQQMLTQGGLLTEYCSGTVPDKPNFPMRNRIVAGMCDATLVIETDVKGGAMITAKLAMGYGRDVFAVPGRLSDMRSAGCHYLIKTNIAQLVTEATDILEAMNWEATQKQQAYQKKLFDTLSEEEQQVITIVSQKESVHIDELQMKSRLSNSVLASILLQLEFQDVLQSLPGKRYKMT